jgi:Phospholipase_D-nuclease N-terminal
VRDCDAAVQPAFAQASFELAQVRGAACAELFSRDRGALVLEVLERREQGPRRCLSQARHLGLAKAAWALFVIVVPVLGVLIYLIAHGQETRPPRPRGGPGQPGAGRRLRSLGGGVGRRGRRDREAKQLLDSCAITQAEFDAIKAKAVSLSGDRRCTGCRERRAELAKYEL